MYNSKYRDAVQAGVQSIIFLHTAVHTLKYYLDPISTYTVYLHILHVHILYLHTQYKYYIFIYTIYSHIYSNKLQSVITTIYLSKTL